MLTELAWQALAGAQHPDGSVFTSQRPESVNFGENTSETDNAFEAVYHSTLVAGLAAAIELRSPEVRCGIRRS